MAKINKVKTQISKLLILFLLFLVVLLSLVYFLLSPKNQPPSIAAELRHKISTWEEIAQAKPDYRDAWLQLAKLHYELKEVNLAKYYVEKALQLDPNYEVAQQFRQLLP